MLVLVCNIYIIPAVVFYRLTVGNAVAMTDLKS